MSKNISLFFLLFVLHYISCCDIDPITNIQCDKAISYVKDNYVEKEPIVVFNPQNFSIPELLFSETCVIYFLNTCLYMEETRIVSEQFRYVINYHVKDFYTSNLAMYNRLIFAGNNTDNNNDVNSAKVISVTICDDYPSLCDTILGNNNINTQFDDNSHNILHCSNTEIDIDHNFNVNIIKSNIDDCEKEMHKHKIEAILAPEPFYLNAETKSPTVFYECITEPDDNVAYFKNAAMKFCQNMEDEYLKLLNIASWRRVAIISDYSEYSTQFELKLTSLFDNNGIIYGLERCTESEEDLEKVLKKLINVDASIIILNTDKTTTKALFKVANAPNNNNIFKNNVWITKNFVWPHDIAKTLIVFNISPKRLHSLHLANSQNVLKPTADELVKVLNENTEFVIDTPQENDINILEYLLNKHTHITDMMSCSIKTSNFYHPCNDNVLFMILGILIVFSIALLVVTTFFMEVDIQPDRERLI